ncbi:MAG: hypothetical protein ABH806_03440 [Candidatus Omnitrophota bacterium]
MSKRLILMLALAFLVAVTGAAYAEVQNVKVSGDIAVMGVARNNFDFAKTPETESGSYINFAGELDDNEKDLLSIVRVRVDADLTDNVSATVRLLNERNWNGESNTAGWSNTNIGNNYNAAATSQVVGINTADEGDISLDLAYVTLKEFLYSPLSLTVGRQELRFGNGLVVGDPDTNLWSARTSLAEGDLSARKSFDAIRATLDYDPLVVDVIYAKLEEGNVNLNDDVTLSGVNASYALNANTILEGFFFNKVKGSQAAAVRNLDAANATSFTPTATNVEVKDIADVVNVIGVRATDKTVKDLTVDAQVAYQFGTYNPKFDPNARFVSATDKKETSNRSAWAGQINATYDLSDKFASNYSPSISGSYTYLSGADRELTGSDTYKGWDPMFEDQTVGHIMNAIFANTNMHRYAISAKAKLTDDITAKMDWVWASFAKKYNDQRLAVLSGIATPTAVARAYRMGKAAYIGQEIDATLTYDYTEDVQFSLLGGILLPSKNINGNIAGDKDLRASAGELIGSMKVTF